MPWSRYLGAFQRHSLQSFVQGLPCRSRDQTPEARRHLPTGETHRSKRSFANGVKLHFAAAWTQRTMQTADRSLEKNHRPEYGCWLCPRLPAGHLPGTLSSQVEAGFPMWAGCGDLTPGTQRPCSPGLHHTWLCSGCRAPSSLCVFAPAPHLSVPGAPARGTPAQSPRAVPPQPGRPTLAPTWRRPSPPGHTRTHCGSWSGSR